MAVHEMLGKIMSIQGHTVRLGHLRPECGLGVASDRGHNTDNSPAWLVRLSDGAVIRMLSPGEDLDEAIRAGE